MFRAITSVTAALGVRGIKNVIAFEIQLVLSFWISVDTDLCITMTLVFETKSWIFQKANWSFRFRKLNLWSRWMKIHAISNGQCQPRLALSFLQSSSIEGDSTLDTHGALTVFDLNPFSLSRVLFLMQWWILVPLYQALRKLEQRTIFCLLFLNFDGTQSPWTALLLPYNDLNY